MFPHTLEPLRKQTMALTQVRTGNKAKLNTYWITNVVADGGPVTVHPVEWHEDVKEENAVARSVVEAIGISSCVLNKDKKQSLQPAVEAWKSQTALVFELLLNSPTVPTTCWFVGFIPSALAIMRLQYCPALDVSVQLLKVKYFKKLTSFADKWN